MMTLDPLAVFAWNVRTRRWDLDLTQEAASDRVLMNASYWSRIERGLVDVGMRTVTRVAEALETTPAALFTGMERGGLDLAEGTVQTQ